jgi:glycerophosphoryl diester phosphodiesterase
MRPLLPQIIAHRGNAAEFPENTLVALQSAVALGVHHVEFDIQLTSDRVPMLLHDADFRRMGGRTDSVFDLPWSEVRTISVGEPGRFGTRHAETRPSSLEQVADALEQWPDVTAFVEIKRASLRRFGEQVVLERVMARLPAVLERCVLISFDLPCLERLRRDWAVRVGWVLPSYDEASRAQAGALQPAFLFCGLDRLPPDGAPLWTGPWQWAIYEVRDLATARGCRARGAGFVETMTVRALVDEFDRVRGP